MHLNLKNKEGTSFQQKPYPHDIELNSNQQTFQTARYLQSFSCE